MACNPDAKMVPSTYSSDCRWYGIDYRSCGGDAGASMDLGKGTSLVGAVDGGAGTAGELGVALTGTVAMDIHSTLGRDSRQPMQAPTSSSYLVAC